MAWTATETARVKAIEDAFNYIQSAMLNLVTRATLVSYTTTRQNEIDALTARVAALEARMTTLEGTVATLT